jgi:hypothetical protein
MACYTHYNDLDMHNDTKIGLRGTTFQTKIYPAPTTDATTYIEHQRRMPLPGRGQAPPLHYTEGAASQARVV